MLKITISIFLLTLVFQPTLGHCNGLLGPVTYFESDAYKEQFPEKVEPLMANMFVFNPRINLWAVYNKEGELVGSGIASGGKDFCKDINKACRTIEGEYTVFKSEDENCTSKTFPIDEGGGAPMPNCMFFYKGYAIHGSKNVPKKNVSHGCIRVTENAAKWIHDHYIGPGDLVMVESYD